MSSDHDADSRTCRQAGTVLALLLALAGTLLSRPAAAQDSAAAPGQAWANAAVPRLALST